MDLLKKNPEEKKPAIRLGAVGSTNEKFRLNKSEYTRANDLIRFGMLYRPKGVPRGKYCVNVKFIEKFLNNTSSVAEYYLKDKITKAVTLSKTRIYLKQVPSVIEIKKKYGETMTRYIHQPL